MVLLQVVPAVLPQVVPVVLLLAVPVVLLQVVPVVLLQVVPVVLPQVVPVVLLQVVLMVALLVVPTMMTCLLRKRSSQQSDPLALNMFLTSHPAIQKRSSLPYQRAVKQYLLS